jgi:hypothetical protein
LLNLTLIINITMTTPTMRLPLLLLAAAAAIVHAEDFRIMMIPKYDLDFFVPCGQGCVARAASLSLETGKCVNACKTLYE